MTTRAEFVRLIEAFKDSPESTITEGLLLAFAERLIADAEWIPCSEKPPPHEGRWLIWYGLVSFGLYMTADGGIWISERTGKQLDAVSHWKSLPAHPSDRREKGKASIERTQPEKEDTGEGL